MQDILSQISSYIWGWPLILGIVGTGLLYTVWLGCLQVRGLPEALRTIRGLYDDASAPGEISHFRALAVALSATIGIGNIAGVATAIHLGGPGAVFWMWVTAVVGMATKYASCTLAVHFRVLDGSSLQGGPMYTLSRGLPKPWGSVLGWTFALCAAIAAFGIGNMVQSHTAATALAKDFGGYPGMWSVLLALALAGVVLGGVRRLASVAGKLVPLMCILYLFAGGWILLTHASSIPGQLLLIVRSAFAGHALVGGAAGYGVAQALRWGVARGVFSNEAGLGSAPMAHAAAQTNEPVREGLVAMLGPLVDTLIVCSFTALIILVTGADFHTLTAIELTRSVFVGQFGSAGGILLTVATALFAFSTALGWGYYGEQAMGFLGGAKSVLPYRMAYIIAFLAAGFVKLDLVWTFADIANGLMAIPNLISLVVLAPLVVKLTQDYMQRMKTVPEGS